MYSTVAGFLRRLRARIASDFACDHICWGCVKDDGVADLNPELQFFCTDCCMYFTIALQAESAVPLKCPHCGRENWTKMEDGKLS